MGNIVPLLPSVLVAAFAAGLGLGIWSLGLGVLVAIPLISRYGFWENSEIRSELTEKLPRGGALVGFVFDRPADWLDAHAEVGLLTLGKKKLTIQTEERLVQIPLNSETQIGRQFNIHQLVGLGGWIRIENEGFTALLVESREAETMYANKLKTAELFERLIQEKGGSEEPPISSQRV
jgi:hypothetical protein